MMVRGFLGPTFWSLISLSTMALAGWATNPAAEETAPSLVEKYNRESNPKRRIKIGTQLTEIVLKKLRSAYSAEEPGERSAKAIESYLNALDLLEKAVRKAGRKGASKDAEMSLRRQHRDLENLKFGLSFQNRAPLEPVLERVSKVHNEILSDLMK